MYVTSTANGNYFYVYPIASYRYYIFMLYAEIEKKMCVCRKELLYSKVLLIIILIPRVVIHSKLMEM